MVGSRRQKHQMPIDNKRQDDAALIYLVAYPNLSTSIFPYITIIKKNQLHLTIQPAIIYPLLQAAIFLVPSNVCVLCREEEEGEGEEKKENIIQTWHRSYPERKSMFRYGRSRGMMMMIIMMMIDADSWLFLCIV